ncbi:hypothetical protein SKAU_G00283390 [Synaphobranchus kaupii]|uniref:Uncharacterized protein n=1 Tax=Synaphobranchus kaupii TaxID=118154 RepID=A0A9Q1EXG5_SYNKA|nr:hypothetical protein SKAU_G00283390 [Synaphobranchus kaupii]
MMKENVLVMPKREHLDNKRYQPCFVMGRCSRHSWGGRRDWRVQHRRVELHLCAFARRSFVCCERRCPHVKMASAAKEDGALGILQPLAHGHSQHSKRGRLGKQQAHHPPTPHTAARAQTPTTLPCCPVS